MASAGGVAGGAASGAAAGTAIVPGYGTAIGGVLGGLMGAFGGDGGGGLLGGGGAGKPAISSATQHVNPYFGDYVVNAGTPGSNLTLITAIGAAALGLVLILRR